MHASDWPRLRIFHRQMYVDLMRAYLADYGTQAELARALNLTGAHISYILTPFRADPESSRRYAYWEDSEDVTLLDISEALKYLKTPARERAQQIADTLCSDSDRREVLLHHMRLAAQRHPVVGDAIKQLDRDELTEHIQAIGRLHSVALSGLNPENTRMAYSHVWKSVRAIVGRIDPAIFPIELSQVLMFLHDAASVLGRHDVALQCARRAMLALGGSRVVTGTAKAQAERFRLNALLAEVVTLNNLGLRDGAMAVVERAENSPGYATIEPEHWKRCFLEEELKSMAVMPRSTISEAERRADEACELAGERAPQRIGTESRLLDIYVVRGSTRNARRLAERLAGEDLRELSPLIGVRISRALAHYYSAKSDSEAEGDSLSRARAIALAANLIHQAEEIDRRSSRVAKQSRH